MLELMKLEWKKNMGAGECLKLIFIIMWTVLWSVFIINKSVNYEGDTLFNSSLQVMSLFPSAAIFGALMFSGQSFGGEIKNSYVMPQGRKKILLSKVYMTLVYAIIIYLPTSIVILSKFSKYQKGEGLTIVTLILINLVLAVSLVVMGISLELKFKSTNSNIILIIALAGIAYLITLLYTKGIPLVGYIGMNLVILVVSIIAYKLIVGRELVRDL